VFLVVTRPGRGQRQPSNVPYGSDPLYAP
jgi:hypothetical protein